MPPEDPKPLVGRDPDSPPESKGTADRRQHKIAKAQKNLLKVNCEFIA